MAVHIINYDLIFYDNSRDIGGLQILINTRSELPTSVSGIDAVTIKRALFYSKSAYIAAIPSIRFCAVFIATVPPGFTRVC